MSKEKKELSLQSQIEAFLACDLVASAAANLQEGASLQLHIDDQDFTYRRENGKSVLFSGAHGKPDAHLWLSINTMQHFLDLAKIPGTGMAKMGVAIMERVLHTADPLRFRLEISIFSVWRKGYFSILKAGGPEVASYLTRLNIFSRVKGVLNKF